VYVQTSRLAFFFALKLFFFDSRAGQIRKELLVHTNGNDTGGKKPDLVGHKRAYSSPAEHHRKALPGAEEVISYKISTYKLHAGPVLYFPGWRRHYSLYAATITSPWHSTTILHDTRQRTAQ
jgi:hypothetical protein